MNNILRPMPPLWRLMAENPILSFCSQYYQLLNSEKLQNRHLSLSPARSKHSRVNIETFAVLQGNFCSETLTTQRRVYAQGSATLKECCDHIRASLLNAPHTICMRLYWIRDTATYFLFSGYVVCMSETNNKDQGRGWRSNLIGRELPIGPMTNWDQEKVNLWSATYVAFILRGRILVL